MSEETQVIKLLIKNFGFNYEETILFNYISSLQKEKIVSKLGYELYKNKSEILQKELDKRDELIDALFKTLDKYFTKE